MARTITTSGGVNITFEDEEDNSVSKNMSGFHGKKMYCVVCHEFFYDDGLFKLTSTRLAEVICPHCGETWAEEVND